MMHHHSRPLYEPRMMSTRSAPTPRSHCPIIVADHPSVLRNINAKSLGRICRRSPTQNHHSSFATSTEFSVPTPATIRSAATSLSPHQWTNVARYLTAEEIASFRLGNKEITSDLSLTSHLQLRIDRAPFFSADNALNISQARQWLTNRSRLLIDDANAKICPHRVAYLVENKFLDAVTSLDIFDCHIHRKIFTLLSHLPNLQSLRLASHASDQEDGVLDKLENIVASIGGIPNLKQLDIEFDCLVQGSRLSFLRRIKSITHLRLRGFDLSEGISSIGELQDLTSLHLCHGNFFSSPSNDVNEKDLINLMGLQTKLKQVHLEGFDQLSANIGIKPFSTRFSSVKRLVLKHCQDMDEECIPSICQMQHLTSLHFINSAYEDVRTFDAEDLELFNSLSTLKSLSLFYVLEDPSTLKDLCNLSQLEVLNIAFHEDIKKEGVDELCENILHMFGSLRKLRIFSENEDSMIYSYQHEDLTIEFSPFAFGDLVHGLES